jgi:hypothetical protein
MKKSSQIISIQANMPKKDKIQKNIDLMSDFNEYMLTHMKFLDSLPRKVAIFFEDPKDPALTRANVRAAQRHRAGTRGYKQVFVSKHGSRWKVRPLAEVEAK